MEPKDIFQSTVGMTHIRKLLGTLAAKQDLSGQEMAILHLDNKSGNVQVNAKWLDTSSAISNLKPAELKFESEPIKWLRVEGDFLLDLPVALDEAQTSEMLNEKVENALVPLVRSIQNAHVLLNNRFR